MLEWGIWENLEVLGDRTVKKGPLGLRFSLSRWLEDRVGRETERALPHPSSLHSRRESVP